MTQTADPGHGAHHRQPRAGRGARPDRVASRRTPTPRPTRSAPTPTRPRSRSCAALASCSEPITGAGPQLVGNTAVWLRSEYQDIRLRASTDADCSCFAGATDSDSYLDAPRSRRSAARTSRSSRPRTSRSTRTSTSTSSTGRQRATAARSSPTTSRQRRNKDARRQIYWETTVIMLGEPNPELTVDASGTDHEARQRHRQGRERRLLRLGETIQGNRIEVGDIQYDSSGVARFRANSPVSGATGQRDLGQRRPVRLPGDVGLRPDLQLLAQDPRHAPDRRRERRPERARHDRRRPHPVPVTAWPTTRRSPRTAARARRSSGTSSTRSSGRSSRSTTSSRARSRRRTSCSPASSARRRPTDTDSTIENPIGTTIVTNERGSVIVSSTVESSHVEPPFLLLRTNILTLNADGGSVGEHTTSNGVVIGAPSDPGRADPVRGRPGARSEDTAGRSGRSRSRSRPAPTRSSTCGPCRARRRRRTPPSRSRSRRSTPAATPTCTSSTALEELQPGTLGPVKVAARSTPRAATRRRRSTAPRRQPVRERLHARPCGSRRSGFYARHFRPTPRQRLHRARRVRRHPHDDRQRLLLPGPQGRATTSPSTTCRRRCRDVRLGDHVHREHRRRRDPLGHRHLVDLETASARSTCSRTASCCDIELNGDLRAGQIISTADDVTLVVAAARARRRERHRRARHRPDAHRRRGREHHDHRGLGMQRRRPAVRLQPRQQDRRRRPAGRLPRDRRRPERDEPRAHERQGRAHRHRHRGAGVTDRQQCLFFGICGTLGVFIDQTRGDLRLNVVDTHGDASLTTDPGDIVDARAGSGTATDTPNVFANTVDLWAQRRHDRPDVASRRSTPLAQRRRDRLAALPAGRRSACAPTVGIFVTETALEAGSRARRGVHRRHPAHRPREHGQGEDLNLLHDGTVLFVENAARDRAARPRSRRGTESVRLQVGDNVTTAAGTSILAGKAIDVHGDYSVVAGGSSFYESGGNEPHVRHRDRAQGTIGADQAERLGPRRSTTRASSATSTPTRSRSSRRR